jgi:hypothetical protein
MFGIKHFLLSKLCTSHKKDLGHKKWLVLVWNLFCCTKKVWKHFFGTPKNWDRKNFGQKIFGFKTEKSLVLDTIWRQQIVWVRKQFRLKQNLVSLQIWAGKNIWDMKPLVGHTSFWIILQKNLWVWKEFDF